MLSRLARYAKLLRARSHRPLASLLLEMCRLRFGPGKIGASEYLGYGLAGRSDLTHAQKQEFIGWRLEGGLNDRANAREWNVLTHDKLAFYTFARGAELPYPAVQAVYHPSGRTLPGAKALRNECDIHAYLCDPSHYPFFGKPIHGGFGRGVIAATACDVSAATLTVVGHDTALPVDEAVARIVEHCHYGYLIQESLPPAQNMCNLTDGQLSTLRVIVMLADDKPPWLIHANWKVPRRGNPVSNSSHGRLGNFVAILDSERGTIEAAFTGREDDLQTLTQHPDSGAQLVGATLPDWPQVRALMLQVAPLFPGVRLQYWDVALSDRGPILLEVNSAGEVGNTQYWPQPRPGFMNPDHRRYIDTWSQGDVSY